MNLLAIETTGDLADLAVVDDAGIAASLAFRHRMDLSAFLIPRIQALLEMARLEPGVLDGIAVSLGPGSFTGIRIGVATAKALALALDRPLLGVPTLDALAAEAAAPPGTLVLPLVDARAGAIYVAGYRVGTGLTPPPPLHQRRMERGSKMVQAETPPLHPPLMERGRGGEAPSLPLERCLDAILLPVEALKERLAVFTGPIRLTGDTAAHQALLVEQFGEDAIGGTGRARPRAETVARLARARLQDGESDDRMSLAPIYIRPSAAEARWEEAPCAT